MDFEQGGYFHVFNRGVDKRDVFMNTEDYARFLVSMREFRSQECIGSIYHKRLRDAKASDASNFEASDASELVDIVAYCLNPNHYHLILRQKAEKGISKYMHKLGMGYTNFINTKYERSGSLFQGKYKARPIESEAKLWKVSFYVNGNHEIHGLGEADKWPWSSCSDFLGLRKGTLCQNKLVLKDFNSVAEYKELLFDYIRTKKAWKDEMRNFEN